MAENSGQVSLDSGLGDNVAAPLAKLDLKDVQQQDEKSESGGRDVSVILGNERKNSCSSEDTPMSGSDERQVVDGAPLNRNDRVAVIRETLETYFSDNYLTRDIFFLKHFRRSKEGWISLKFMASFKRIKRTAKSVEEVKEAAQQSAVLEVNVEGNKLRRLAPLPACIEEYIPTRTAVVGNLPETLRTLTGLSKYAGGFGNVVSIQLLRPGSGVPEALRETVINFPKMREQWCAAVEYDQICAAEKLVEAVNTTTEECSPSWALELVMPWKHGKHREYRECNKIRSCPSSGYSSPCPTPEASPISGHHKRTTRGLSKRQRLIMNQHQSSRHSLCNSYACQHQVQCQQPGHQCPCMCSEGPRSELSWSPSSRRQLQSTGASKNCNWRAPVPLY